MSENSRKILIVDDSPTAIKMLQMTLEEEGYEIITAYDGDTGFEKALKKKPDAVILDVMMPGITGFQVCEKIKGHPETRQMPVIMLTGKDSGQDFDIAMEKKADWYIVKPYDVSHLLRVLSKLIQNK
ncbi:MAG: response regulator [Elusimicrobiota bacterium]